MDQSSMSPQMSRTESGLSRMSGSRTNEGLEGSEVGTRSQDEDGNQSIPETFHQALRRRRLFDHTTGRSTRPVLHRKNAAFSVARTSVTAVVETIVDVADAGGHNYAGLRVPIRLAQTIDPLPSLEPLRVPTVPPFPTLSMPTVPTVPAYPFNTPSSQSILSSPPSSPAPSETSFASITDATTSSSLSFEALSSNSSDLSATTTSTNTVPTINVSYGNSTLATSTRSDQTRSSTSISPTDRITLSSSISDLTPQGTPGSTVAGAAGGFTGSGAAPPSVSTSSPESNSGTDSTGPPPPSTPQVVGGVVGGLAGFAVILLIVLFFLRRYRQHLRNRGELLDPDESVRDAPNTMSMHSSHTPLVAAVAAPFRKMRPDSSRTNGTGDTGPSDRGFQRVAGRKIEPVLSSGGDGYGGNYGAFEKETSVNKETGIGSSSNPEAQPLAGTSFYRSNSEYYDDRGSGASTPVAGQTRFPSDIRDFTDRDDDDYNRGPSPDAVVVIRPSPARSPVTSSAGPHQLAAQRPGPTMASDTPPTPTLPARFIPDGVGRSLISQDGSRGSRFTESV